jgi:ClpP class serine protease
MPNWNDVLKQLQEVQSAGERAKNGANDIVRRDYLTKLHAHTGRNVIAYYSGFLSKPGLAQLEINDEDKNGFMMAVHKLDRKKGLDILIHTPGGNIGSTQSIVDYLRKIFCRQRTSNHSPNRYVCGNHVGLLMPGDRNGKAFKSRAH